jgi:GntR family transcriptional regulator
MGDYVSPNVRIVKELETQIRTGVLVPGDQIPTLAQLQADFKVSYSTVRSSILQLKAMGLVEGRQGYGMFVCEPKEWLS